MLRSACEASRLCVLQILNHTSCLQKTPGLVTRTGVPLSQFREHSRRAAPRRFTSLKPGPTPDMAQSTTSTTPDPLSGDVSPMEQGAALSLGHQTGPAGSGNNTPASRSHPSQDDRKRSRAADPARQDANRSGHTAPLTPSSVHAQYCMLHAMDTTTTSDDRGARERGAEAFSEASFQSLTAPISEGASFPARSHAQKVAPISGDGAC